MMRTITVRGVGNVSARPDYITISMTIESIRKDYDGAMRDASERISKLQDVAVRSGYAKEDLKTTSFNVDVADLIELVFSNNIGNQIPVDCGFIHHNP